MTKIVLTYEDFFTIVEPDLLYLDDSRLRFISLRGIEGAPTLAVEIISRYSKQIDRRRKTALYAAHDVTWYWIVDPDAHTIDAYRLEDGTYHLDAKLEAAETRALPPFPDLPLDPAAVWL